MKLSNGREVSEVVLSAMEAHTEAWCKDNETFPLHFSIMENGTPVLLTTDEIWEIFEANEFFWIED